MAGGLLHWAAFCGHESIVQRLLENGVDVAWKDRHGQTAMWNGHEAVAKLLLEKGANVESRDPYIGLKLKRASLNRSLSGLHFSDGWCLTLVS